MPIPKNKLASNGSAVALLDLPERTELPGVPGPPEDLASNPEATVLLELPLGEPLPPASWGIHLDARLSPLQSLALRRLTQALDQKRAALQSGKRVVTITDAVKWLFEHLAAAARQ